MSNNLIKKFYVLSGFPEDLEDGFVDVLVTLTNDEWSLVFLSPLSD